MQVDGIIIMLIDPAGVKHAFVIQFILTNISPNSNTKNRIE